MSRKYAVELSDEQWQRIEPLLPKPKNRGKGGRPRADDRACLEGILWVLRSGARWRDLPERFPSPSTCWRRLGEWEAEEVLDDIWRAFLDTLDERGLIDWDEVFVDGTFAPAKKGGTESVKPSVAREQSWFWWRMVRVFRSHALPRLLLLQRSHWRKKSSNKSPQARGPRR
jgi:transposase